VLTRRCDAYLRRSASADRCVYDVTLYSAASGTRRGRSPVPSPSSTRVPSSRTKVIVRDQKDRRHASRGVSPSRSCRLGRRRIVIFDSIAICESSPSFSAAGFGPPIAVAAPRARAIGRDCTRLPRRRSQMPMELVLDRNGEAARRNARRNRAFKRSGARTLAGERRDRLLVRQVHDRRAMYAA